MKPQHVRLFVKTGCGWCRDASQWLDAKGIRYDRIDVTSNRAGRQEMLQLSGQTLAPVLQADGRILADFDTGQLTTFWRQFEQES
ncbi:MAG: glutaredoxin family protein [Verrucomicrobiota bacterium]|jgi:glutaredoxin